MNKILFLHLSLELGMFLRRSFFFESHIGQGMSQILVRNGEKVSGSGPHNPALFFWEYRMGVGFCREVAICGGCDCSLKIE